MPSTKHPTESGLISEKVGKIILGIFLTLCVLHLHGASGADTDRVSVSVMEGESVTLHTGVEMNQKDRIKWYLKNTRIAQIIGNISICTDVQCNEGTETFRGRLKLDDKTGSLTITNIRTTDSGLYELQITSSISNTDILKTFNVTVSDVPAGEQNEMKIVKEGKSVTLDPGVIKNTNDMMMWYFNDTLIAEITGDQSQICTDDQCKERFRDRLKLDHQNGSLTITNTRNTDSGLYQLQINSSRIWSSFSIRRIKNFNVTVSGPSSTALAGLSVIVLVVLAATATAGAIYCHKRQASSSSGRPPDSNKANGVQYTAVRQNVDPADVTSHNQTETDTANGTSQ